MSSLERRADIRTVIKYFLIFGSRTRRGL
jgi:hypothetical protein